MAVLFSPFGNHQFLDEDGLPANGCTLTTYAAGSSTPLAAYTTSAGNVAHSTVIDIGALGFITASGNVAQLWLTEGLAYKLVLKNAAGVVKDDPDNITGVISSTAGAVSQWQPSGLTPTYVSATSFTLAGDQTTNFHVGRRLKTTNTSGEIYSTITISAYAALTTVTVVNDSGVLDSGLSAVSYGILTYTNQSIPTVTTATTATNLASGSAGTIPYQSASGTTAMLAAGTAGQALLATGASAPIMGIPVLRGFIDGLTLSTAGSSATMSVAAGVAADSTNVFMMTGAGIAKTTSAWAVGTGNGGLDTGAIANTTWYYYFLIRRPDTGVVDVVFSATSASPTLPANYTQYRYIGAGLTNGSAQWIKFIQAGDEFWWDTPILDFSGAGAASRSTLTCSIPRGRKMKGRFNVSAVTGGGGAQRIYLSDLSNADLAPSTTLAPLGQVLWNGAGSSSLGGQCETWTNTSAQIGHREATTDNIYIATLGWVDMRGKGA